MGLFWEEKEPRDLGKGLRDDEQRLAPKTLRCAIKRGIVITPAWSVVEPFFICGILDVEFLDRSKLPPSRDKSSRFQSSQGSTLITLVNGHRDAFGERFIAANAGGC